MVALLHFEAAADVADDDAMESADPEFPAPVDPPAPAAAEFPVSTEETSVAQSKSSSRPRIPVVYYRLRPKARLRALSEYICSFDYWLSPHTNFNSQKNRPLCLIMETAKLIVKRPQPIKCVEAVFVALLLTAGLPDVDRFPLSFQTVLDKQVYQHIVLLVQYFGKFGAFGISRWPEFMCKDLKFDSMSSVIEDYKQAYEGQRHVVSKIRIGLPVEHNTRSTNFVCWRHLELNLGDRSWKECRELIDEFAGKAKRLYNTWIRSGKGENPSRLYLRQTRSLQITGKPVLPREARASESVEVESTEDARNVNCRFNVQPPSSRESARVTLSLEPEEDAVDFPPVKTKKQVARNEFSFIKPRRSKRADAVARSVKSIREAIRSLPRAAGGSLEPPSPALVVLGKSKSLGGTPPGYDEPKAFWECLRGAYRAKNEARLLLLKEKLSELRTQGPLVGESFRIVQDIFQYLVGIGDAIASKLDGFEGAINALTDSFDAAVQSVDVHDELHSLKHLAEQLTEELDVTAPIRRPQKTVTPKRSSPKEAQAPPACAKNQVDANSSHQSTEPQSDMGSVDQLTPPNATTTKTTKKKMSLVQRRLRSKLMSLLGMGKSPGPQPVKSRRKTNAKKKSNSR